MGLKKIFSKCEHDYCIDSYYDYIDIFNFGWRVYRVKFVCSKCGRQKIKEYF